MNVFIKVVRRLKKISQQVGRSRCLRVAQIETEKETE